MFHECVMTTMSSRFLVPLFLPQMIACTKDLGEFLVTMTGFASFLGVAEAWFIDPVGCNVKCRGDHLEHCFKCIYDEFPCNSTGLNCTK